MVQRARPLIALVYAITAILFTGLGLIIVSMVIGYKTAGSPFYFISFGVLGFGVLLILIGIFGSLKIIKRILSLMDSFSESGAFTQDTQMYEDRGRVRVIRQKMPESVSDTQISKPKPMPKHIITSTSTTKPVETRLEPKDSESAEDVSPTITLNDALQSIVDRYNLDKVKQSFSGWNETLVMRFPDIGKSYMYIIDGSDGIKFQEGIDPEAAVQVEMDSVLFQKLIAKQVNAIKAYSSGKMNVSGQMKNMLKLRKLMF